MTRNCSQALRTAALSKQGLTLSVLVNTSLRLSIPVCVQGEVLAWELESSHLAQRTLRLPAPMLEAPFTAFTCHSDGSLVIGDAQGAVWRLQVCSHGMHTLACRQA